MQILTAEQIRTWDEFTIRHEPIPSIDLMERAASRCLDWLEGNKFLRKSFNIYCGKGNNGGDGLALARLLSEKGCIVIVYILEFGHKGTEDFQMNLARLHETSVEIRFIQKEENFHHISQENIIVDALFGSGLNRPLEGLTAKLINHINSSGNKIISIDIPSGLYSDKSSTGNSIIRADHTLSFECYKLAFLLPANGLWLGILHILNIGLHKDYLQKLKSEYGWIDRDIIHPIFKPRNKFSHKGDFGHVLLVAGSYGKMGAAILSSRACLKSGAGLLTTHIPKCGYAIMQTSLPEAMVNTDENEQINTSLQERLSQFTAVGIGPGLGQDPKTALLIETIFKEYKKPIVIDADALNLLASNQQLVSLLPPYSILTPHPKEFERLFGSSVSEFERLQLAKQKAIQLQCIIVLKGHYSFIAMPDGLGYFNSTGNPGMAKAGSGDVLTGIITAFLAQGYQPKDAAILGVFLHGLAGDFAASFFSEQSVIATDISDHIGTAILSILQPKED